MGLGILELKGGYHVCGTIILYKVTASIGANRDGMKDGAGKDFYMVLVP